MVFVLAVRAFLSLLFLAVPILLGSQSTAPSTAYDSTAIAITGVSVIDVLAGVRVPEQTVLVRGNRIVAVRPAARMRMPLGARRIDGRGKYLIPGLWDMHVHTFRNRMDAPGENTDDSEVFFPAFVANGVTGVRDMSTDLADNAQIRRWMIAREARRLIAPRMIGGSPLLDGKPTIQPNALPVTTVSDARRIVDSLIDGGVGYIKVYSGLKRDVYFAIADQAKRRGVMFAGHVPLSVKAGEASDAGQRSIEHLTEVLADCSPELRAITERQDQRVRDSTLSRDSVNSLRRTFRRVVSERLDCKPLAARFARNRTWQVPTFTVKRPRAFAHDSATRADRRLKFISPQLMAEWKATGLRGMDAMSPTDVELQRTMFRIEQRIVGQLHAAGVPLLAGTDVHNPYVYPGFSLHDELALLVESGLSPLAALRTATINPARFLSVTDSLGTIAPGKIADLVMLDADPLLDIANTQRIRAVFLNGRFLDRGALDSLLAAAERTAAPRPRP